MRGSGRPRTIAAGLALLALAGGLEACSDDGRELREPRDDQTTTTEAATASTGTGSGADSTGYVVQVDGVPDGAEIPVSMTCEGANEPPVLSWQNVPPGTAQLAVSVTDPDAGGFVHWLVLGIEPSLPGFDGADLPPGASHLVNGAGEAGWFGPCPPPGEEHTYELELYALPQTIALAPDTPSNDAVGALRGSAVATADTSGTFTAAG